jgi:hypothetical protein
MLWEVGLTVFNALAYLAAVTSALHKLSSSTARRNLMCATALTTHPYSALGSLLAFYLALSSMMPLFSKNRMPIAGRVCPSSLLFSATC